MIVDGIRVHLPAGVNRSPWECPKCHAPGGQPCRRTRLGFVQDPPGSNRHVWADPGSVAYKMHPERPRVRCTA